MAEGLEETAGRLAALAHPARLKILRHLARERACCCGEVVAELDLAQSTVSQHLKVLVEAGLVRFETERQRSRYAVDRRSIARLTEEVRELLACCCADAPA